MKVFEQNPEEEPERANSKKKRLVKLSRRQGRLKIKGLKLRQKRLLKVEPAVEPEREVLKKQRKRTKVRQLQSSERLLHRLS